MSHKYRAHLTRIAATFFLLTAANALQYTSNMFLNGDYENGLAKRQDINNKAVNDYRPGQAAALASLLSKRATPFVGQMYLPTLLECKRPQQCVPKEQCINGYFRRQLPNVQNCEPEVNVCCTYQPPPTTSTTVATTTTQKRFITCTANTACVYDQDCRNGEILSNVVVNLEVKKCYEPKVCCGIPSTMLTEDGYVLKTPPSPFTYPAPSPFKPTTPVNNQYLPPGRPTPSTPADQSQPITPITTSRQPQPTPADRQTQPSRTQTQTTRQERPTTKPQSSTRATTTKPLPSVTRTSIASTSPPKYLPPSYSPQQRGNDINERDRDIQSTNQDKVVLRGEDQLSPQIFPTNKFGDQFGGATPAAKCASALVCTAENYCNSIGVISETPAEISSFRVPLTDCLIEGTGAAGKCCRDPNYVDPWPVNLAGVCAQRNTNTKPRGVRDIDASFAEIGWQAMILKESTKMLLCGGAIIGDAVVLTTASCVRNEAVNDVRVKAGEWELGSTNEPLPFQLVAVKAIEIHPNYDANTGSNDMAVVHLSERLQFATHIQPICISDKDPSSSETCITTGWGKQALSIHEEGAVMHVTVTNPVSRSECGADESAVCSTTKFDSCQFDAGSALACGTGSNVQLKGIYGIENACGEGQAVRFIKPDVAWVNKQFMERSKPLLLRS